jgi:hypothetical protein
MRCRHRGERRKGKRAKEKREKNRKDWPWPARGTNGWPCLLFMTGLWLGALVADALASLDALTHCAVNERDSPYFLVITTQLNSSQKPKSSPHLFLTYV